MVNGEIVKLNYPEVVADHHIYRGRWTIKIPLGMIAGLNTNLVWRVTEEQPGGPSELFSYHALK